MYIRIFCGLIVFALYTWNLFTGYFETFGHLHHYSLKFYLSLTYTQYNFWTFEHTLSTA